MTVSCTKNNIPYLKKQLIRTAACTVLLITLLPLNIALAENESDISENDTGAAENITMQLNWTPPLTQTYTERLADSDTTTMTRIDQGKRLELFWTDEIAVQGFWLEWKEHPAVYLVEELSGEQVINAYSVMEHYDNRFLFVGKDCRGLRITTEDTVVYCTLQAYGPGTLPEFVHFWSPPAQDANLLIVAAHPDDEQIFMGGLIPYYVAEKGLTASVMIMTCSDRFREDEALNGLWAVGMRNYPIFGGFRDLRADNKERVLEAWNEKKALGAIVQEIRRCKPEVVVTHDIWGEYGHGAHRACSYLLKRAVKAAADPEQFKVSAEEYGAWQVQKLYFHAWREDQGYLNRVDLNYDQPLSAFDGRTPREMAAVGYSYHVSQSDNWMDIMADGKFDCAIYALVLSTVGADEACDDLFEHIDLVTES